MTRRVSLPDGQWADVVERLNHAQRQRIRFAGKNGQDNVTEGIAAMLTGWHVLDVDGAVIPVPGDRTAAGFPAAVLDTFPSDVVDDIAMVIAEIVTGDPVPKAGPGTSDASAEPDSGSQSMTDSPMPISLPITPGGPTKTYSPPPPTSSRASK